MILNPNVFLVLLAVLGVGLFLGIAVLLKRTGLTKNMAGGSALVVAVIFVVLINMTIPKVYIVTGTSKALNVEENVGFWGASYMASNGCELSFSIYDGQCGVINDSEVEIALEPIFYGSVDAARYDFFFVEPGAFAICKKPRIKLMPDETPGGYIKVRDDIGGDAVYWLRELTEEEKGLENY